MSHGAKEERPWTSDIVWAALYSILLFTNGCMGKHCGVKPSWDYADAQRQKKARDVPGL